MSMLKVKPPGRQGRPRAATAATAAAVLGLALLGGASRAAASHVAPDTLPAHTAITATGALSFIVKIDNRPYTIKCGRVRATGRAPLNTTTPLLRFTNPFGTEPALGGCRILGTSVNQPITLTASGAWNLKATSTPAGSPPGGYVMKFRLPMSGISFATTATGMPHCAITLGTLPQTVVGGEYDDAADSQDVWTMPASGGTPTPAATGFTDPTGVAADNTGDVFVSDSQGQAVDEFNTTSGSPPYTWSPFQTSLTDPTGLAVAGTTPSQYLYVADGSGGDADAFNLPGSSGAPGPYTGLTAPAGVAADSSGNVFIADGNSGGGVLEELAGGGTAQLGAGTGPSGMVDPTGVAVTGTGASETLYVTDAGTGTVWAISPPAPSTAPVAVVTGLIDPAAVAVDSTGNLFVADGNSGDIEEVSPPFPGTLVNLASLANATGIAVTGTGANETLYIADASQPIFAGGGPMGAATTTSGCTVAVTSFSLSLSFTPDPGAIPPWG